MLTGSCHCGRVTWRLETRPDRATACNCTICRRYGALWAYGHIGHTVHIDGATSKYRRDAGGRLDFHFCPHCGCMTHYIDSHAGEDGRQQTAVNLRMCDPEPIAEIPIRHFDGHVAWKDQPSDSRTVGDMWF